MPTNNYLWIGLSIVSLVFVVVLIVHLKKISNKKLYISYTDVKGETVAFDLKEIDTKYTDVVISFTPSVNNPHLFTITLGKRNIRELIYNFDFEFWQYSGNDIPNTRTAKYDELNEFSRVIWTIKVLMTRHDIDLDLEQSKYGLTYFKAETLLTETLNLLDFKAKPSTD
jgi:hypothetical protein